MSTSAMLFIKKNNELKVAQYTHWDGYLSAEGVDILKNLKKYGVELLSQKIEKCYFVSYIEQNIYKEALSSKVADMKVDIPDSILTNGSNLIEFICKTKQDKIPVLNYLESLDECIYAYLVDFDKDVLEVYHNEFKEVKNCLDVGIKFIRFELKDTYLLNQLPSNSDFEDKWY